MCQALEVRLTTQGKLLMAQRWCGLSEGSEAVQVALNDEVHLTVRSAMDLPGGSALDRGLGYSSSEL